jgi:acetyl esterase/lipase
MSLNERRREVMNKELEICLERVETDTNGTRRWRELYFAQPLGYRALTMNLEVPLTGSAPPVVVYIHGGGWMFGHPDVQNPNLALMRMFETLLGAGFAVARISYRLSGEGRFPTQVHDCKAAIRFLRHHAGLFGVNADSIGAIGESAGGHLALMLGLHTPPEFEGEVGITGPSSAVQAVVNWYGIANMLSIDSQVLPDARVKHDTADSAIGLLLGGSISGQSEVARRASPVTWVTPDAAPCLIQHGTADSVVPPGQGEEMFQALSRAGVPCELDLIEGADHCFIGGNTAPIMPHVVNFLNKHLKNVG